jgi:hypothetical protein
MDGWMDGWIDGWGAKLAFFFLLYGALIGMKSSPSSSTSGHEISKNLYVNDAVVR